MFNHSEDKAHGDPLRAFGAGVLCLFFVSGACGLIHEVAWTRLLRLVMGNTTFSITTVLCAFMGGLALGSYLGGRIIDRRDDALRIFALLEGSIGLYCLLLPWFIDGTQPIYRFLYQHTHTSFYAFGLIRFLFSGLLLLIPATLMGATLPVLTRFFARSPGRFARLVGTLYAINTFGAVLGASATGFMLIPHLGVLKTIYLACLLNVAVCAASYLLYRRTLTRPREPAPSATQPVRIHSKERNWKPRSEPAGNGGLPYGQWTLVAVLVGYGFSGFAALVYEIAWTRVLSLLIGSSVYAFSMMLTAFVLGLAVGSMVYARFADRVRDPMLALAIIEVAIGFSALAVVPFVDRLPFFVTGLISRFIESFWLLQGVEFALILAIMLVPTLLMGAAFPLANRLFNRETTSVGRSVGTVYGCNTVGNILGSFMGGFVLVPMIGIQHTIFVAVVVNVGIGTVFLLLSRSLTPWRRGIVTVASVMAMGAAITLTPAWDVSLMSFGPFHEAARITKDTALSRRALENMLGENKVLFHKEGLGTTVTVKEDVNGVRSFFVNGKPDASSSTTDLPTQALLAHVPLLLHPEPRSALVIGLASGITLGSAGRYPLEHLDCAEIEPTIVEASRYFDEYNYRILDDPRVNIIIGDGRNHLALTNWKYDVITSEPSNPYFAGIADLFTREFFQLCHERLTAQGIACIWLQQYNIDPMSFRSIIRTFHSVFPNMTIWHPNESDCLLIGSKGRLAVDHQALTRRMGAEAIASDLKRIDIKTIPDFLSHLVMGQGGVVRFSRGAPIHTDDNALLEFSSPRALTREVDQWELVEAIEQYREADLSFLSTHEEAIETLAAVKDEATRFIRARGHLFQGRIAMNQGRQAQAIAQLQRAAVLNPEDSMLREFNAARHKEAFTLIEQGQISKAITLYRMMLPIVPNDEKTHHNLASLLKQQGDLDGAMRHYEEALHLKPDYTYAHYNLAEIAEHQGSVKKALVHYRQALLLMPELLPALNNLARLLATHQDPAFRDVQEAIRLAEKACQLSSYREASLLDTLAMAYAAAGRFPNAEATAGKALNLALSTNGNQQLADAVRARLMLYGQKRAYRMPLSRHD